MRFGLLLLLAAAPAWASFGDCGTVAGGRIYCKSTGDQVADGIALSNLVNTYPLAFPCGTVILLDAGASYATPLQQVGTTYYAQTFRLYHQSGCAPGQYSEIRSTRADEIPAAMARYGDTVINSANYTRYLPLTARLVGLSATTANVPASATNYGYLSGGIVQAVCNRQVGTECVDHTNNWKLTGLTITTDPALSAVENLWISALAMIGTPNFGDLASQPENIWFDYIIGLSGEELAYGPMFNATTEVALYRSVQLGFIFGARRSKITHCAIFGTSGFDPTTNPTATRTSIASSSTLTAGDKHVTVLHATGISAFLGIHNTGDITGQDGLPMCTRNGLSNDSPPGCVIAIVTGVTGACANLNGYKTLTYVGPDDVAVGYATTVSQWVETNYYCAGSLAGSPTVRGRVANLDPAYQLLFGESQDVEVSDTDIEDSGMTVFFPGGGEATAYGVVQSGSTQSSFIVDNVTGRAPAVGDVVAAIVPPGPPPSFGASWVPQFSGTGKNDMVFAYQIGLQGSGYNNYNTLTYCFQVQTAGTPDTFEWGTDNCATFPHAGINMAQSSIPVQNNLIVAFGSTTGHQVGDRWTINQTGIPANCTARTVCSANARAGVVTAVSQSGSRYTLTVAPTGPQAINAAPMPGYRAVWDGNEGVINLKFVRDVINRNPNMYPLGKGHFEMKSCDHCLIDGVQYLGSYGYPFCEVKNQTTGNLSEWVALNGGVGVYSACKSTSFSNSLWRNIRNEISSPDYEATSTPDLKDAWIQNNLILEIQAFDTTPTGSDLTEPIGGSTSGYRHNTMIVTNPYADLSNHWAFITNLYLDGNCPSTWYYNDTYAYATNAIRDNIMSYGQVITPFGYCYPNQMTQTAGNLFIADGPSSGGAATDCVSGCDPASIVAQWPGNRAETHTIFFDPSAHKGFVGNCTQTDHSGCSLDPASPYKGTATDGKDPGADLDQWNDRQNGWSDKAGLQIADIPGSVNYVNNPAAWKIGAMRVALTFRHFAPIGLCSVQLFTDPARVTPHADTATVSACTRPGDIVEGDTVTVVLGTNSPLSPATHYYWKVTDGNRVMVGQLLTLAADVGGPISIQLYDPSAADARIEYAASADLSGSSMTPPAAFASGVARPSAVLSGLSYYRWIKRDGSGRTVNRGPISVAIRP